MPPLKNNGRDAHSLVRGAFEVRIVPELGGRMMSFSLCGHNFLFENPTLAGKKNVQPLPEWNGVWQNFGGEKIWPSPQGWNNNRQWGGPPEPVLDGGYFKITQSGENFVELESPCDPKTGLQIRRRISLDNSRCGVNISAEMENLSESEAEWSVWPVAQMRADSAENDVNKITFPAPRGYKVLHGLANNPQFRTDEFGNAEVSYGYVVGKIGAVSPSGWIANVDTSNGKTFAARFDFSPDGRYANCANVEVWTSGWGVFYSRGKFIAVPDDKIANPPYMEIELVSPLQKIARGESAKFSYSYFACTVPSGETVKSVSDFAAVSSKLSAEDCGDCFVFSCSFGVFADGKIGLFSDSGKRLCADVCVSPLAGTRFSAKTPKSLLAGAKKVFLVFTNNTNTSNIEEIKL